MGAPAPAAPLLFTALPASPLALALPCAMEVLLASRPWSFTASLSGVALALALALGSPALDAPAAALLRLLPAAGGIVLAQAGANLVNTYEDHARGVDVKGA